LDQVEAATLDSKAQCDKEDWVVYKKKNGEKVKLRPVLEKISYWVTKFKKIVDIAVSFDQSGHAALPWAVVGYIITVRKQIIHPLGTNVLCFTELNLKIC
jgi:hypothetical protein